ncbi:calcium-translocating P-type ATPase [Corchorus olitorius]|uniref:Calcium-translocating P-type ATPase n=1 Tax=Corchorus olitorius TaxID=93759 RepID=A0A1R3IKR3_9ROSI|nr:calcium-translocating P-type ATPase [Corchorus olitorius]
MGKVRPIFINSKIYFVAQRKPTVFHHLTNSFLTQVIGSKRLPTCVAIINSLSNMHSIAAFTIIYLQWRINSINGTVHIHSSTNCLQHYVLCNNINYIFSFQCNRSDVPCSLS